MEIVFRAAKYVLSENRRSMTPQDFGAIMFLKFNCRFRDAPLVEEAIRDAWKKRASGRYIAHKVRGDEKFDSEEEKQFRFFDVADMKFSSSSCFIPLWS